MALSKNIKWTLGIVAVLVVVAAAVLYPKLVVTLPKDGADAKQFTFKATHGKRYTEMFLIGGNAITKNLEANVYNNHRPQRLGHHRGLVSGSAARQDRLLSGGLQPIAIHRHAYREAPRLRERSRSEV